QFTSTAPRTGLSGELETLPLVIQPAKDWFPGVQRLVMLHIAVVLRLAGERGQVPAHSAPRAPQHLQNGHDDPQSLAEPTDSSLSRTPEPPAGAPTAASSRFSSAVGHRPDGATILDASHGSSVVGSGSVALTARQQTMIALPITRMSRMAKNAESTPSTVELVTTVDMSSRSCAGASTSPRSSASEYCARCAKNPIFG